VVSSAIVDKYIGESARLIREMFGYAKEHQPCIIFMDEIDAIGGRRFSEGTSADREIQRTLMELLSQLDGFDVIGKVRPHLFSSSPSPRMCMLDAHKHPCLSCMAQSSDIPQVSMLPFCVFKIELSRVVLITAASDPIAPVSLK
jgi:SpoVK/Ycf46/Vps4 family AAA+-type ATPase